MNKILRISLVLTFLWVLFLWGARVWFPIWRRTKLRALLCITCKHLMTASPPIVWWIDFGTLLGYMRERDIILDDNDVDICVRVDSEEDRLELLSCLKGLEAAHPIFRFDAEPWVDAGCFRIWLDSFFVDVYHNRLDTSDGSWLHGATGPNSNQITTKKAAFVCFGGNVKLELIERPRRVHWAELDVDVFIPHDPVGVLEWRYGPDWCVPSTAVPCEARWWSAKAGFKGRDGG